ncbi:hypothetical protein ACWD9K_36495 [Streptomyces sp. 900116325]
MSGHHRGLRYSLTLWQDDEQIFEVIKSVVLVLNDINQDHDGAGYESKSAKSCASTSTEP